MPYKKRISRKRKPQSALSRAYNHKFSVADVAKQVQRLKGIINSELHHHDLSVSTGSYTTAGAVSGLTLIAQGDGVSNRQGLSLLAKSLEVRLTADQHASATATALRIIVFTDNMQDGTLPTVTEVLESATVLAHYESDNNIGRFGKLYDQTMVLDVGGNFKYRNFTIPLGNKHIKFNGTDATQASQGKQSIYLLGISNEATNAPSVNWVSRVKYYDN